MPTVADRLLKHIRENPGSGRAAACLACDITSTSLSGHINRLRDRGLVSQVGTYALVNCKPVPVPLAHVPDEVLAILRRHIRQPQWTYLQTAARWDHVQPITVRRALAWIKASQSAEVLYGRDLYLTDPETQTWHAGNRIIVPITRRVAA